MKVLSIDTSSFIGGCCVYDSEAGLIGDMRLNLKPQRKTHSETLMLSIDHTLKRANIRLNEIDMYALVTGPGSFTGLRVGVSIIKGFCFAQKKPVAGVTSLEALAWNFAYSIYPVCAIAEARKNELYSAVFKWNSNADSFDISLNEAARNINELTELITEPTIITGTALAAYKDVISTALPDKAIFSAIEKNSINLAIVAQLGLLALKASNLIEPETLKPTYMKKPPLP
ncbi:peptidase M22, glycoprotease [Candidatus Magnetoovum chiemensis]|nr:peptidase M22, glycoprotease [Candidatus Magnetoovum chiemensis]